MRKHKWVWLLSVFFLLIFLEPVCLAENETVFSGSDVQVGCGKIVEYSVSLENNTGLAAYQLSISFDTNALHLQSVSDEDTTPYCIPGEAYADGTIVCARTASGCKVIWYGSGTAKSDGTAFTLRLMADENAAAGTYRISVSPSSRNCVDTQERLVSCLGRDGSAGIQTLVPTFCASTADTFAGEELVYTISVRDNPGIASFHIGLCYDEAVMTPVTDNSGKPVAEPSEKLLCTMTTGGTNGEVQIAGVGTQDYAEDGVFLRLRFRVKADAPVQTVPMQLVCYEADIANLKSQRIEFGVEHGAVNVLSPVQMEAKRLVDGTIAVNLENISSLSGKLILAYAAYADNGQLLRIQSETVSELAPGENKTIIFASQKNAATDLLLLLSDAWMPWNAITP